MDEFSRLISAEDAERLLRLQQDLEDADHIVRGED